MKNIIVFGRGGHARVVIDIINSIGDYKIVAVIDNKKVEDENFLGIPVFTEDQISEIDAKIGVIAIGDNKIRKNVAEKFSAWRLIAETIIHPRAIIGSNVSIASGSVVMPGTVVNCFSTIGEHCIINSSASIDHDCMIGSFASIAPGVVTGGNVKIGSMTHIGLGAKIIQGITVGESSVIGAGSVVVSDFPGLKLGMGVPCRVVR